MNKNSQKNHNRELNQEPRIGSKIKGKKTKRDPISSLFIFIFTAFFDGVKFFVRKVIIIATFIGLVYLSAQMIFKYNPSIKAQFDEKREMVTKLLSQAEGMMEQLEQINNGGNNGISSSTSPTATPNLGGLSITPEMISAVMGAQNDATQQRHIPSPTSEQQPSSTTEIPNELQPFLNALRSSKNYPKYVEMLASDKVGHNGEGATPILEKALKTNNENLKRAALESLNRIGTNKALEIANRYGK